MAYMSKTNPIEVKQTRKIGKSDKKANKPDINSVGFAGFSGKDKWFSRSWSYQVPGWFQIKVSIAR